jgi:hypothetical protein
VSRLWPTASDDRLDCSGSCNSQAVIASVLPAFVSGV